MLGQEIFKHKAKAEDKKNTISGLKRSPHNRETDSSNENGAEEFSKTEIEVEKFGGGFARGFKEGEV